MRRALILTAVALITHTHTYANTYLVTSDYDLLRVSGGSVEAFTAPEMINSMASDQSGDLVYAVGRNAGFYEIQNPAAGTPVFTPITQLSQFYTSIIRVDQGFFGLHFGALYQIDVSDPNNPSETRIGDSGLSNTGGFAYDSTTGNAWVASGADDTIYEIDLQTAAVTLVGPFGFDAGSRGLEWWNGQLYGAVENNASGELQLGTFNTQTGLFSDFFSLGAYDGTVGLAVVPEPNSALLFMLALPLLRARSRFV